MALSRDALQRALSQYKSTSTSNPTVTKQPVSGGSGWLSGSSNPTYRTQPVGGGTAFKDVSTQPVGGGTAFPTTAPQGPRSSPVNNTLPNYDNVDQFDFNRNYEDILDGLQRQRADLEQQRDLNTQRLNEDYGRQFRDVRQGQTDALDFNTEKMAGQGILRSGIAVKSAGEIGAKYGNELDSLQRQLSSQIENVEGSFAQQQRQIQEQIGRAQEQLTRQQQQLEEQRARQAAAAEAAQRAAQANAERAAQKQRAAGMLVKDNLGKYFMVDPTNRTRQLVSGDNLASAEKLYGPAVSSLQDAGSRFGEDYVANANALARRLGGNLNNQASLDVRLGFRDLGAWR